MSEGLVWFRSDLRLLDNPAWSAATTDQSRVTALFVVEPAMWESAGALRRNLLAAHLEALHAELAAVGGGLFVAHGDPVEIVPAMAEKLRAEAVHWNRDATPYSLRRDSSVREVLGRRSQVHEGRYVHPPGAPPTRAGGAYRVFTPFHRAWSALPTPPRPLPGGAEILGGGGDGIPDAGRPIAPGGERAARRRLDAFLERIDRYDEERDRPDLDTTSHISADLKFGTLDPRRVLSLAGDSTEGRRAFARQLAWRDFYAGVMTADPASASRELRADYRSMRWRDDGEGLQAWQQGRTGYPIVDAGMRQLLAEGWMHNRVRMITASFLVKDLLIDWRQGERHFRRLLVDADVAQNVGNWQWVAGTGADAAPYFRVFNPVSQGRKFDPDGDYVRRWVPELAGLDGPAVHAPWEIAPLDLAAAGVILGDTYQAPIVDHAQARIQAIAAFEEARGVTG